MKLKESFTSSNFSYWTEGQLAHNHLFLSGSDCVKPRENDHSFLVKLSLNKLKGHTPSLQQIYDVTESARKSDAYQLSLSSTLETSVKSTILPKRTSKIS